jgi:very-short-patch-repair endonuclease
MPCATYRAPPTRFGKPACPSMAGRKSLSTHARSVDLPIEGQRSADRSERRDSGADRTLGKLASSQHGVVSRRQLIEAGVGSGQIEGRVNRGQLHLLHRGVYAVGHRAISPSGRKMAAVLACGEGAVLSHRSAGQAWGLTRGAWEPIEVTRRIGWRAPTGIRVHRDRLASDEVTEIDGIPVTSLPRTILDLARVLDRRRLERAIHEVEVRGLTDALSLPDLLERYPRKPGSPLLRSVLADLDAGHGATVNDFEALFADLIIAAQDLPMPRFNADLSLRGRFIRPDALWDRESVIVELDGRATHGTALAFEDDRERDRLLLADGWRVVRVTWRQLREDPDRIVADLRTVLRRGGGFYPVVHEH